MCSQGFRAFPKTDLKELMGYLKTNFEGQKFTTKPILYENGVVRLQVSKSDRWRDLTGFSYELDVEIRPSATGTCIKVTLSTEKFILKAVVGVVAFLFVGILPFLPLFPLYGSYLLYKTGTNTWSDIGDYFTEQTNRQSNGQSQALKM